MRLLRLLPAALLFSALIAPVQAQAKTFEYIDSPSLSNAPLATDYSLGKPNSPVTFIEYASLSCPHCAHFHSQVLPELKKRYIDTGKMIYILRQFPLNEPALKGAMLVDCVGSDSGAERYYTFVRVLFEAQDKWAMDTNFLTSLQSFAGVGGVGKPRFDACMNDSAREIKLLKIKQEASKDLKVTGTPSFYINGRKFDSNPTAENFIQYIDALPGVNTPAKAENSKKKAPQAQ